MSDGADRGHLEDYIKDYVAYCKKYSGGNYPYASKGGPKSKVAFSKTEAFHPEERAHHHVERQYWKYNFRVGLGVAIGTFLTVFLSIASVLVSAVSLRQANVATQAAVTQAEYAKTSFEASTRASIVTFGVEWAEPPEHGKSGFVYILFGNNGKDPTSVIANPSYAFGPHQQKFGFGDADVGPNTSCNKLSPISNGVTALPLSGATYKVPFEIPVIAMDIGLSDGYSIIVRGCFAYKDLGRVFHTPFCYVAAQKGATATQSMSPLCTNAQAEPD